jgi:hypothetical protein
MHIFGHFPSSVSMIHDFWKLALLLLSGETIQPNQLIPLDKANLNPQNYVGTILW